MPNYISDIGNQLLFSPYDGKAGLPTTIADALTEEEFLKNCYSEPQFLANKNYEFFAEIMEESDNISYDVILDKFDEQKKLYYNFIRWLENDVRDDAVYTISGNAGSGKTTFVYKLKAESEMQNWIILNMADASDTIYWLNDKKTHFNNFELPYKKIYASMLKFIKIHMFNSKNSENEKYINEILDITGEVIDNYKKNFGNFINKKSQFFEGLIKCYNCTNDKTKKIDLIAKYFVNYFDKLIYDENNLGDILDIFLIFIQCRFSSNNKTIIVFDNIERFISDIEIYSKDIDDIRKRLNSYTKAISEPSNRNYNLFKFVMVVRNKTARMMGVKLQSADNLARNLDIGDWFDIDDIIEKRYKWLDCNLHFKNENITILRKILGDIRSCGNGVLTGLYLFINPLFNENKRLIIDFLGKIIEQPSNKSYIDLYLKFWEENTDISRFAARSIIRGLILKQLEKEDSLFKHLQTYSDNKEQNGLGTARLILTILNKYLSSGETDIPLDRIIQDLTNMSFDAFINRKDNKKMLLFVDILFYMNSYNRRTNDWIQFIDLQIKDQEKNTYINNPNILKQLMNDQHDKISLNIMPAGKLYLKQIVASFEFFSLRYIKDYKPLFSCVPTEKEIIDTSNNIKNLECYQLISKVRKRVKKCIDIIKHKENIDYYGLWHKDRITIAFNSYLDKFLQYIDEMAKHSLNEEVKNNIKKLKDEIINLKIGQ